MRMFTRLCILCVGLATPITASAQSVFSLYGGLIITPQ